MTSTDWPEMTAEEIAAEHEAEVRAENYGGRVNAFCDQYEVHEGHWYNALNGDTYKCPGLDQEELDEINAYDPGVCEHGMSADLCAGPSHYPLDM